MKKKTLATLVLCGILTVALISGGMPAVAFAEGLSEPDVAIEQETDIQDEDFTDEDGIKAAGLCYPPLTVARLALCGLARRP